MPLTKENLRQIAISIRKYLTEDSLKVFDNGTFDSVTDNNIGFSFYKQSSTFSGNLKKQGAWTIKGRFEGRVINDEIYVQEEGQSNSFSLPLKNG